MNFLYSLSLYIYQLIIQLASLFNPKAKEWVNGRKDLFKLLQENIPKDKELIWFHCASVGEFEQARPIIEAYPRNPKTFIFLSFFSPSGYLLRKNYSKVDYVSYLPIDLPGNAKKFIQIIQPDKAVFVKYEFWFNLLQELSARNTPTYLVAGIFRKKQHFFSWYGSWFKKQLSAFHTFFVQDETSKNLLASIGYQNAIICGDPRFDRVIQIAAEPFKDVKIESFKNNKKVLIIGSAWETEIDFALKYAKHNTEIKILVVPHEIEESKLKAIEDQSKGLGTSRYSIEDKNLSSNQILILNRMGILSKVYRYADIALIGGGFKSGIHNCLEAAVYGIPVVFGPNYKKFKEAKDLVQNKGAFAINNFTELQHTLDNLFDNNVDLKKAGSIARDYVLEQQGSTQKILKKI